VLYARPVSGDSVVVFVADRFHTMEPAQPVVEAVAVQDPAQYKALAQYETDQGFVGPCELVVAGAGR
jgi:hypothetical protein